ncbi:MAG: hypothetical protein NC215_10165, partial [Ruminococcus sp.]|nr:hypothetical protein [Ruminococcus sp.]
IMSTSTAVFAAEYTENKARSEYFDSALSGYLKNIIDTNGAVKIAEKEKVDEEKAAAEQRKAARSNAPMRKAASSQDTESTDLDIDHTRLTLDLDDGENMAYLFSEPVSFINKNGELVYKDTNIRAVTNEELISQGYTYENGNNDYKVYFSADSSKGVLIVTDEGYKFKIIPNGENSVGEKTQTEIDLIANDAFSYANAYGADTLLRFLPQLNGLKDEIVLDSYNSKSSFDFTLDVGENVAAINSRGEVEIIAGETKDIIQTFEVPFAYDAIGCEDETSDHYTDCTYSLEKVSDGKYILSVNVPEEFLTDENTVYPVTIDPTTSNISNTYDTGIYSSKSTSPQNANATFCVGRTVSSQYGRGRGLVYFKIPSDIKNYALISEAKYWVRETTGRTDTMNVTPYPVKDSWNNDTTWETRPSWHSTFSYPGKTDLVLGKRNINSKSTDNADNPYWYAFNITNAVRAWTTGTTNRGLLFRYEKEDSSETADFQWRAFASKEHSTSAYHPYAVIKYTNDTTVPTISSVSGNPTDWTNGNVTLKVTATDNVYGASGIASYSFDNGSTWQTSNSKSFSSNQTVNIKVKDLAGNISKVNTVKITKIDKTKPTATITLSPTTATNGSVTATINLADNAALKSYKIGSDAAVSISGTSKTVTKTYSADSTVSVTVTDAAGNTATASKSFTNIDKIVPKITKVAGNPTDWTKNDVTLTVTATDEESGVASYSFDDGKTWQTSNSKTFDKNQTVKIKVKDKAGNISAATSVTISKIDKTIPTASASCTASSVGARITVTASDGQSGLNATAYSYAGGAWTKNNYYNVKNTNAVAIKVRDAVGNVKEFSITPNPAEPVIVEKSPTDWTNGDVTITVKGTNLSKYKFDGGEWQTANTYAVYENGNVAVAIQDKFGMDKSLSAVKVDNIDTTSPEISEVALPEEGWENGQFTVTVSASDDLSGIAAYSFDDGDSWQEDNSKTYPDSDDITEIPKSIVVLVKDNAGNISVPENVNLPDFDSIAPPTPVVYAENGNVYLADMQNPDNVQSAEHLEYKIGESGEWTKYEEPLTLVNTYDVTVYARSCDEAGNISEEASTVVESRLGEYTASYTDIAYGDGVFPVPFERTYSSVDGWFFSFEANIKEIANGYVFTDFSGDKHYFIKNNEEKYASADGDELELNVDGYAFKVPYGELNCYFGENGKLAFVKNNYISAKYSWSDKNLNIEDNAGNVSTVRIDNGKVQRITIVRVEDFTYETKTKNASYQWEDDNIIKFVDAAKKEHNYTYTNGLLSINENEFITYSAQGRVKLISQPNGAFVKYTYIDEIKINENKTDNIVIVSDSKGVTDTWHYSDGITITNSIGSYSDEAVYNPSNISSELESDKIADVAYVVKDVSDGSNNNSTSTDNNNQTPASDDDSSLYDKNDDGSYTFYSYDEQDRVVVTLEVKAGTLNVTKETTFDDAEAVAVTKTNTVYADGSDNVKETVTLKRNAENVFENSSKETYEYNTQESIKTYTLYSGNGNGWQQNYCEEYEYNDYGNNTKKTVTVYNGQSDAETGVRESTITVTDYIYDVWNQPVETTESVYANNTASEPTSTVLTKTLYDILGRTLSVTEDGETTVYTYDDKGNVSTVDVDGSTTKYTYDTNGNLKVRTNPDNTDANYDYDGFGNLTRHDYNGYSFSYNTLGSILTAQTGEQNIAGYTYSSDTKQDVLNANFGNGQSVKYDYNEDGELTAVKLGEETKYGYSYFEQKDENGNVTKEWSELTDYVNNLKKVVEDGKTTVNDINGNFIYSTQNVSKDEEKAGSFDGTITKIGSREYVLKSEENKDVFKTDNTVDFEKTYKYENDNLSKVKIGGVTTSYGYTADKMISLLTNTLSDVTKSYGYKYDKNGNITTETLTTTSKGELGETIESTESTNYTYDKDKQLTAAENDTTKWEYEYDTRGNILSKKEYAVTLDADNEKVYTEKASDTYSYDVVWKDKLTSYNGQEIIYDDSGNPTSYLGHNLTWTMGRQLASFDDISYTYNENGIRTSKISNGVTTKFYLNGTDIIEQTDGTTTLHFYYDSKNELIGFNYADNDYFYVKNSMSDITDIVDNDGNIIASYMYDPWGKIIDVTGDTVIGNLNPFRYRSYYYDNDIEMYYLQSRYYDANVCRFINCDDVNYIGISESEVSYNPFAYCGNSPVNDSDPDGRFARLVVSMAIGAFFAIVFQYIVDVFTNIVQNKSSIFKPVSTIAEYILAAIGGAISATGIGKWTSVIYSVILSNVGYLITCLSRGTYPNLLGVTFNTILGIVCGLISGSGANLRNNSLISKTCKGRLKTIVSVRKITMYKSKLHNIRVGYVKSAIRLLLAQAVNNLPYNVSTFLKKYKVV